MDDMELWVSLSDNMNRKLVVEDDEGKKIAKDMKYHFGRPAFGKILVLRGSDAVKFTYDLPWACISIWDDHNFPEIKSENRVELLQLIFKDYRHPDPDLEYVFTREQADQIALFAERNWDRVGMLMIHCYAGISRSTAVAQAISDVYQPEYSELIGKVYWPNPHVYELVTEAFQGR